MSSPFQQQFSAKSPLNQKEELTDKDKERKAKKLKKTAKQLADPNIEMSDWRRKMKKYKKTKEQTNQEQNKIGVPYLKVPVTRKGSTLREPLF